MNNSIVSFRGSFGLAAINANPPALFLPNAKRAERFLDFFTANIRNKNTRRAYYKASCLVSEWCQDRELNEVGRVKPLHVAAYIEVLQAEVSHPTVKQHMAAIRMLFYTFAQIGAVLKMNGGDYFTQGRRGWVHLHDKGGKEPCNHKLEALLDEYIAAASIPEYKDWLLFRTTGRTTGTPQRMAQPDAYRLIQPRATQAGIRTKVLNHSLRATGIADYLKSNGTLEQTQAMTNHSSRGNTKLCDRRREELTLDEYERVGI